MHWQDASRTPRGPPVAFGRNPWYPFSFASWRLGVRPRHALARCPWHPGDVDTNDLQDRLVKQG